MLAGTKAQTLFEIEIDFQTARIDLGVIVILVGHQHCPG